MHSFPFFFNTMHSFLLLVQVIVFPLAFTSMTSTPKPPPLTNSETHHYQLVWRNLTLSKGYHIAPPNLHFSTKNGSNLKEKWHFSNLSKRTHFSNLNKFKFYQQNPSEYEHWLTHAHNQIIYHPAKLNCVHLQNKHDYICSILVYLVYVTYLMFCHILHFKHLNDCNCYIINIVY